MARLKADWQLLAALLGEAAKARWHKRWLYKSVAWTFYSLVRLSGIRGHKSFTYRRWDYEPTLEQLEREVLARRSPAAGLAGAIGLKRRK